MEAAGNPEVKCEIHNTQGLREGVQPHHIFIHQYFITRGQRWVVAVSQIFSPYRQPTNQKSPPYRSLQYHPIRTLASLRNPTPPTYPHRWE